MTKAGTIEAHSSSDPIPESAILPLYLPRRQLDEDAVSVCRRLQREGFVAYLVGGCVRDIILERTPKDFDVGTTATPAQVRRVFRNCRLIGRRFRLAHVYFGAKIIEVATFRGPGEEDEDDEGSEREDQLIIRANTYGSPEEDARSRDFTINGLFYDPVSEKVIDYVGGYEDVCSRIIRTIGEPEGRFREDPVRMLRAVRFAARLGCEMNDTTLAGLVVAAPDIGKCPVPRVTEELYRILEGHNVSVAIKLMADTGILDVTFPELAEYYANAEESYLQYLAVVDEVIRAHYPLPRNFVMALAYYPLLLDRVQSQEIPPGPAWGKATQDWFRTIGVRMHMAVKHRTRLRSLMSLMGRFLAAPGHSRRFRLPLAEWQALPQALTLLRIHARIFGGCDEAYETWRDVAQRESLSWVPVAEGIPDRSPARKGKPTRRRRRRRSSGPSNDEHRGQGGNNSTDAGN